MTPRSLFNIILKIFGLFFVIELINAIPNFISSFLSLFDMLTIEDSLGPFIFSVFVIALYVYLIFKLIFRSNYFIDKLKLDQGFNQEEFSLNIPTSKVLMIALFVIAGVILIDEIPNFCGNIFFYLRERRLTLGMTEVDLTGSIISFVKILIALLLIGERNRIVNFIHHKRTKKEVE